MSVHFSTKDMTWETPKDFFDKLDAEFNFDLDVCATDKTAKCKKWYTPKDNGLAKDWAGKCYMNPPYGREIGQWMKKASESKCLVVCLVPVRTDTKWWHDYVMKASEIRYIRGWLKFGGHKNSAPFPSAVVIFKPLPNASPTPGPGKVCEKCKGKGETIQYDNQTHTEGPMPCPRCKGSGLEREE